MKLETTENIVLRVLKEYDQAKKDDFYLYFCVCREINFNVATIDKFSYIMLHHKELGFPSFSSVTRARRKIFEKHPELKPFYVTKKRKEKEEEYIEYARNR